MLNALLLQIILLAYALKARETLDDETNHDTMKIKMFTSYIREKDES